MKILIAGLGSIGRRHLANLRLLEPAADITVWHQHSRDHDQFSNPEYGERHVFSIDEALESKPEAALVTGPASTHIVTATQLARSGLHLFIEKPLSHTLEGVDELADLCKQKQRVLMVGYNFRFYEPLQLIRKALHEGRIGRVLSMRAEVGQYLPDWRPKSDYRQSGSARSELGGGAVLELSHEIDYVRWLIGEVTSVIARVARLSDLEMDVEDTAEIILQFSNGALGSLHLDMVQRPATRSCRIVGDAGTITWDWASHRVRMFTADGSTWHDLSNRDIDRNEMYLDELRHFLACVRGTATPLVDVADGRRVLEIALAIKRSSVEQRAIEL
jgi:predicted dehydrogenase